MEKDEPIAVYNDKIVCFNNQNINISVGDYIIYQSKETVKIAHIETMQEDGRDIDSFGEHEAKDIGIKIDDVIKKNDKLRTIIKMMK